MARFSASLVASLLAAQAHCFPSSGNERRQSTLPAFVNTYGIFPFSLLIAYILIMM